MTQFARIQVQHGALTAVAILFSIALIAGVLQTEGCSANNYKTNSGTVAEQPLTLLWGPYLTGTNNNSTVVNIKNEIESTATVHYATEAYYTAHNAYNRKATDGVSCQQHHITLSGLKAGTTYHYQVSCNGSDAGDFHFSTFPDSGEFTFVVYGDTQDELPNFSQAERHKLIADRIAQEEEALFVLNTGDLVNDGHDAVNWDRYFDATRTMAAGTTVYPARGNHDGDTLYYDIFGVSPYYSFDCVNAHFTILDSVDDPIGQSDWMTTDLANNQEWKFVVSHHPIYTSEHNHFGGWEDLRNEWEKTFISQGVEAVWSGNIHAYERYQENGIMYLVMGIGGGPYGTLSSAKYSGYQNSLERSLGYAKVTIDPDGGTALVQIVQVADISADGKVVTALPMGTIFETFTLAAR